MNNRIFYPPELNVRDCGGIRKIQNESKRKTRISIHFLDETWITLNALGNGEPRMLEEIDLSNVQNKVKAIPTDEVWVGIFLE